MNYWRMQQHPSQPANAVKHTITSLAAGYIGLDFGTDVGDLHHRQKEELPQGQQDYWDFAHRLDIDDVVLIIAHHFPFALVKVNGPYNYLSHSQPHIGVWFRHFRAVRDVAYFADFVSNALNWPKLTMTDTISLLVDKESKSYRLIEEWLGAV